MKKHNDAKEIFHRNAITGSTNFSYIGVIGGLYETHILYSSGSSTYMINEFSSSPSAIPVWSGSTFIPMTGKTSILNITNGSTMLVSGITNAQNINGRFYFNSIDMSIDQTVQIGAMYYTYLGKVKNGFAILTGLYQPPLLSIRILPTGNTYKNLATTYTAIGYYSGNTTKDISNLVYWSVDSVNASITNAGVLTALSAGTIHVKASYDSLIKIIITGTTTVVIPTIISITLSPSSTTIASGSTRVYVATALYSDSSTRNVTTGSTWSISGVNSGSTISQYGSFVAGLNATGTTINAYFDGVTGSRTVTTIPE